MRDSTRAPGAATLSSKYTICRPTSSGRAASA